MNAEYTFLIAGESNEENASEALPALNQVIAFPTLINIARDGAVKKYILVSQDQALELIMTS